MKDILTALDQREKELLSLVEEIQTTRQTLIRILGEPTKPSIRNIQVEKVKSPSTEETGPTENINLKSAFETLIPVIERFDGASFTTIRENSKPLRGSKSRYAVNTIKTYLSSLNAAGFIQKRGAQWHLK
jgi:hypothetical protein